jgi:hypothetical protein
MKKIPSPYTAYRAATSAAYAKMRTDSKVFRADYNKNQTEARNAYNKINSESQAVRKAAYETYKKEMAEVREKYNAANTKANKERSAGYESYKKARTENSNNYR